MSWSKETKELTLSCKTWVPLLAGAITVGGILGGYAVRSYAWIWRQDAEVEIQHTEDLSHDAAIKTLAESNERAQRATENGCAIAAKGFSRWYCKSLGVHWGTLREEEDPDVTTEH